MKFTKLQSAGNDFIAVEALQIERDWSKLAVAMCDRHFGIGADGLLLVLPSEAADFRARIFNSDGSEAEICGNGLICLAKYLIEEGLVDKIHQELTLETAVGPKKIVKCHPNESNVRYVQVNMGTPQFKASEIPVAIETEDKLDIIPTLDYALNIGNRTLLLSFLSIGNPHAVYFLDEAISGFNLTEVGPMIEHHPIFPQRVNFEVAKVISRQKIAARVWERGVGETLACGSGACAIAVTARLHGYTDDRVAITLPGGVLNVEWDGVGEVRLSGYAEMVFTGVWLERK